jgi:hypothetical protein
MPDGIVIFGDKSHTDLHGALPYRPGLRDTGVSDGYDIFTGDVDENHKSNRNYGEIHTGDEWIPARDRYCRPHDNFTNDMPDGIVIFGDKSHTDLHGALLYRPGLRDTGV